MLTDPVTKFLQDFPVWASTHADILAVALVGSYARQTATAASDLDLVLITDNRGIYLKDLEWTHLFGEVKQNQIEQYGKVTSIRTWYTDGLDVEYGITDRNWVILPLDAGTLQVISGRLRVMFERGNILTRIQMGDK